MCAAGDVIAAMNAFAASGDFALDMTIASYGVSSGVSQNALALRPQFMH